MNLKKVYDIEKKVNFMMIEQFYKSLYHILFFEWIVSHSKKYAKDHINFQIIENNDQCKTLLFQLDKAFGKITIWSNQIVEEEIHSCETDELLFYLHFTITDFAQTSQLFHKFYRSLLKENKRKKYHIAICGTGGLSTALFVDEMQEACQLENTDFQLHSLSIDMLYDTYQNYDAIYLAPQIAQMQPQLMSLVHHQIPVHRIDATDFATNNYHSIIKTLQNHLNKDS